MGGATNVEHEVSFGLPHNSQQISTSDYIIIDLSNFTDVTAPTGITGNYSGTPIFSVDGNNAKVTGIVVLPGVDLVINGITATNPTSGSRSVTVIVSEDEDGLIIKNVGSTIATTGSNTVNISVTIDPPVASLSISGYAGPGTFVTFSENGSVIGTDTAGPTGFFSQIFTGLNPGDHTIQMYGVDQEGRATPPTSLSLFTPIYQQTDVSDVILPPTIELDSTSIAQGDDLVVFGKSVPDADMNIFTESPLRTYSWTVDSAGDWGYTITDTADYYPGDYRAYSLVQSGSLQSLVSASIGFSVSAVGVTPSPAGCDISDGNLNCDSTVNLTDFSILMYYWGTSQPAGDVNSDGTVNLTDFSIMMYYWGT